MADRGANRLQRGRFKRARPMTVPGFWVCYRGSKTGLCAAHFSRATRGRAAGRAVGSGCHPEIYAVGKVCARCHRKRKDLQAVLCADGTLVSVCGLMLLLVACRRRVRLIRTCPVGITRERTRSEGYERPALPRQNDPQLHSHGPLTHERPALPRQPERPSITFTWQSGPSSSQDRQNPARNMTTTNLRCGPRRSHNWPA
jgi:hypothetical protein